MKKKILVIENDEAIRHVVCFVLEAAGYIVEGCNYKLAEVAPLKPDLVLVDEWVNLVEGHMLCKDMKAIPALNKVPVIIFSTSNDIIGIVKTCGADGYVCKPFDLDTLLNEIRKFLPVGNFPNAA